MNPEPLSTEELMDQLNDLLCSSELEQYISDLPKENSSLTFSTYFNQLLQEKNLRPAEVIRDSQIQRNYGYQILNGQRSPGRDKILALSLSASLSIEETGRALKLAKVGALYPKNVRDSILIFALNRHLSVSQTNELLYEYKQSPL